VTRASVAPKHAYYAGRKPVSLRYLFRSRGHSRDVTVRAVHAGSGDVVARWRLDDLEPGTFHRRLWRARARDGKYRFRIGSPGYRASFSDSFELHGHRFPVKGAHGTRGPIGDFGAPRSGGRVHDGFDVTAPCGTPLLAIRAGRVERAGYDPQLYGNFVEIDARESRLDYFYAHMVRPARVGRGDSVKTSERLGKIGLTGNAAGTPCHLHVELRQAGRLLDPEPALRRWDRYG
jgi:murein DD-endopeptidase MepM/ murein hydrolase activator NlpD